MNEVIFRVTYGIVFMTTIFMLLGLAALHVAEPFLDVVVFFWGLM